MMLKLILKVEIFDLCRMDFMGLLPSSYRNKYVLVAVYYICTWMEMIALSTNVSKHMLRFLCKNIFARFGCPHTIISNGGSYLCNNLFSKLMAILKQFVSWKFLIESLKRFYKLQLGSVRRTSQKN